MKYLFILLFLSFSNAVTANNVECTMVGMQYYPQQKEISLNPMFIIEGFSFSQEHIEALKEREVYLESATGEKIMLEFQELLKGQMELTQAIFRPVKSLAPNSRYYLKLSAARNDNELKVFEQQYNYEKKLSEPVYWETTCLQYTAPLCDQLTLEFKGTLVEFYGCGPAANAVFSISHNKGAEVWYRTEVENLQTGKKSSYYLMEWNEDLHVGHDMCSGAFTYAREGKYKVRFTPLNIDGKELKTTSWTTFESPFINAENSWGY